MHRGFAAVLMMVAGSASAAWHMPPVASVDNVVRETRVENSSGDMMNMEIAKIAGRAAFQPPSQAPLTKQELFSVLLLVSEQRQSAQARS